MPGATQPTPRATSAIIALTLETFPVMECTTPKPIAAVKPEKGSSKPTSAMAV